MERCRSRASVVLPEEEGPERARRRVCFLGGMVRKGQMRIEFGKWVFV